MITVQARIVKAGGRVCNYNGIRVMGLLAMSRAFGDHCLSEFGIIAEPEVCGFELHTNHCLNLSCIPSIV